MYKSFIKSALDFLLSLIGIVVLFPVLLLLIILLVIINRGSPFFIQQRPGYRRRNFFLVKFKTMNNKCDFSGNLLSDSERLTHVGRFIRRTSLDELPQLFNVIKGDMSLIGPRPLLIQYLPLYDETQKRRHEVKPGITGWAQVNGRNAITWKQKFEYDVWYVDNMSFALDFKILLMTVKKVFKSEGITQVGHATAEAFTGNN